MDINNYLDTLHRAYNWWIRLQVVDLRVHRADQSVSMHTIAQAVQAAAETLRLEPISVISPFLLVNTSSLQGRAVSASCREQPVLNSDVIWTSLDSPNCLHPTKPNSNYSYTKMTILFRLLKFVCHNKMHLLV